jgi:GcrA cell cycle regulator
MLGASSGFDWNDATIARLRSLWAEGHSTAEIGRRLGFSKNAIVGKAHRLHLPARPSPISRSGATRAPKPRRTRGPSLPALTCLQHAAAPSSLPTAPMKLPPPSEKPAVRAVSTSLRSDRCCWPIGEPGTPAFRFCEERNETGRPYCPDHCQIAYRKTRDRRDNAA